MNNYLADTGTVPTISAYSKEMFQSDKRPFLERSECEMANRKERLAKLQQRYKDDAEERELTFQPNLSVRD